MGSVRTGLALGCLLQVVACTSASTTPKDAATTSDLATADLATADLATPDHGSAILDSAVADEAIVDLAIGDAAAADSATPPDMATAPDLLPPPCAAGTFLGTHSGGAGYIMRMPDPASWNGTLVLYAQPKPSPGAIPATVTEAFLGGTANEDALLAAGFALAGSSFERPIWAVNEGITETRDLQAIFANVTGCTPARALLAGFGHTGSIVAQREAEESDTPYDGVLVGCGLAGGIYPWLTAQVSFKVAAETAGNFPPNLSTNDVADTTAMRANVVEWENDNPGGAEFTRVDNHFPDINFFYDANGIFIRSVDYFGAALLDLGRAAFGDPFRTSVAAEWNSLWPRDQPTWALNSQEQNYLTRVGVNWASLINSMHNFDNCALSTEEWSALDAYGKVSGALTRPVLAIHERGDFLALPDAYSIYTSMVAAQGQSARLRLFYTTAVNAHCEFTSEQLVAAVQRLDAWVQTGTAPQLSDFAGVSGIDADQSIPAWRFPTGTVDYYETHGTNCN